MYGALRSFVIDAAFNWTIFYHRTANHILYTCILPLRMWRLQQTQPEAWDQINFLQEDNSQSFSSQAVWRDVAEYIHNTLGVTDFTTREIIRLCSIKVIERLS